MLPTASLLSIQSLMSRHYRRNKNSSDLATHIKVPSGSQQHLIACRILTQVVIFQYSGVASGRFT